MNLGFVLHQTVFGAVAAAGFGVLFNAGFSALPKCAASGAVALAVRTCCLELGWNLEGASFAAALAVGIMALRLRAQAGISSEALRVVGCIPMVPGMFAQKAIVGLFALTAGTISADPEAIVTVVQYTLRVMFTMGAIGTGVAIPALLSRVRASRASTQPPGFLEPGSAR
jgi:uncharacterized membrane protein YjjB (DUF3815 family)